ncbi:MAG: IPT/TIG domain-containing protein [Bryobacteraceae bacterium]|jgi:uncharacterized protein (TIGR03437 family)
MGAARKLDLDRRLDVYFATLRSSSLKDALKRSAGNWQIYAAVTGSAMAMVTSASASIIGNGIRDITGEPIARSTAVKHNLTSSKNIPIVNAVRLAMANGADLKIGQASQAQAPSISTGGVVPLDGRESIIQPGEWVSIFGTNLASGTFSSGDFPTSLGGTRVEINGKAAFLLFVSPGQINLQAPDDTATGPVSVVVTTAGGSATSTVTLNPVAPSFLLLDANHVSGIILRSNGSGAYGGGTYDILGPTGNSLGYPTVAAHGGDMVELFGVGFGPTTPVVPAGQAFSSAAPINDAISLYINNIFVKPAFVGLSSAGLYQINLRVPRGLGQGDVSIKAVIAGMQTQTGVAFSLRSGSGVPTYPVTAGGGTVPGNYFGTGGTFGGGGGGTGGGGGGGGGGTGGGTGGGASGGSGGGSGGGSARPVHGTTAYEPRLRFPPA